MVLETESNVLVLLQGYGGKSRMYIATQAPMENTRVDFWEMVWQQQSQAILMLTDLDENGQVHVSPCRI